MNNSNAHVSVLLNTKWGIKNNLFYSQEQYTVFENIRFNPNCLNSLLGLNINNNNQLANEENVDPNEILIQSHKKCEEENKDIVYTRKIQNQNNFYILKNWKCHRNLQTEKYVTLGRKPCEYSFEEYISKVSASISAVENQKIDNPEKSVGIDMKNIKLQQQIKKKQEEVHSLLLDIFESVSLLHAHKIISKDILLDNIRICEFDNHHKAKIVNLSAETVDENAKVSFTNDLNNLGKLYLSMVTYNKRFDSILNEAKEQETYEKMFKFIDGKISNLNWIEPYRKKLLSDLIIYLIEIDGCSSSTILDFKMHPFVWDGNNIEDFLRIINCRIDLNDKEKDAKVIKKRIEKLNLEMNNYDNWEEEIESFLASYLQKPCDKISSTYKCNDLVKFVRNKVIL